VHIIRDGVSGSLAIRDLWHRHAHGLGGLAPGRLRQRLGELQLRRLPYYGMEFLRRIAPASLRGAVGNNLWGPRVPGMQEMVSQFDLLEVCAIQWRTCVEQACIYGRSLPPNRYMELRLEHLSPRSLAEVLEFCELDANQDVTDYIGSIFNEDRPKRRLDEADPADLENVRRWVAPTMAWLESTSRTLCQ
jgi:hypothetical protein